MNILNTHEIFLAGSCVSRLSERLTDKFMGPVKPWLKIMIKHQDRLSFSLVSAALTAQADKYIRQSK
jgi:hypothetical protein